ncbi:beta-fructofuranosidase [Clostridium zeae]|uniref:Sucrose-6-phosphate hydrolase n=1 Tax=Clostridium zeae TaxID=2759022 RepID=A0ABQ1EBC5_9CLOT|nr:glycoside hydrolase family 32 protein [Clostridium zeae]GFZ32102.1 beta-fructofuranosidase [Clostridium zeae]
MNKLENARDYIKQNKDRVNPAYRPEYHAAAEIGWINDPNGFCYFNGEYHLFYQYYPYASQWGPMHWGHIKSKDLVKWEQLPVALAPDMYYDASGCFSGSAIEVDGKLYLMYTGHIDPDPGNPVNIRQIQNIAVSEDGINFEKIAENPVIGTKDLPEHALVQDFRDPKVFRRGDEFYTVVGSRHVDGSGQILLYKSENLIDWSYLGVLARSKNKFGKMWECPDLFEIDDTSVLIMSPQFLQNDGDKYCNIHSGVYLLGNCNLENCSFDCNTVDEIDGGFDFYAPQTLLDENGRHVMIAWMQMWDRTLPTNVKKHGWAGAMTLPREIKIVNGKLHQIPVEEIKQYRINQISYNNIMVEDFLSLEGIEGQKIELELTIDSQEAVKFGLRLLMDESNATVMYFDRKEGKFIFDRSKNGEDLGGVETNESKMGIRKTAVELWDNKLKLRIFIDRCSVEIFIQDGERAMTSTVYPSDTATNIEFFSDKQIIIEELNKWEIKL